jgi:hypothetical protein
VKTFWPTFWATLAAILVAVAVIVLFIEIKSHLEFLAEAEAETAALKAKTARLEKDRRDHEAEMEELQKVVDKSNAEYRKAHNLPEPIYPTLDEAFASPTPQP